jgi:hypothetical protein
MTPPATVPVLGAPRPRSRTRAPGRLTSRKVMPAEKLMVSSQTLERSAS